MSKERELRQLALSYERLRRILDQAQEPVRDALYEHERPLRAKDQEASIHHLRKSG